MMCVERGPEVQLPGVTAGCHGKSVCMHTAVHRWAQNVHTFTHWTRWIAIEDSNENDGYIKNTRYSQPQSTDIDPQYAQI